MKTSLCCSILVIVTSFVSCSNEELETVFPQTETFFNASGATGDLQAITFLLKQKNDSSEFVPQFVRSYGCPLWQDAVSFSERGKRVYAVPIKSLRLGAEIEAIWFFQIGNEHTDYALYTRRMADEITAHVGDEIEQTWMFDYFTYRVLNRRPVSGVMLTPIENKATTRGTDLTVEIKCVRGSVEVGGSVDYKDIHCWFVAAYVTGADGRGSGGSGGTSGTLPWGNGESGGGGSLPSSSGDEELAGQRQEDPIRAQVEALIPKLLKSMMDMGIDVNGLKLGYTIECKSIARIEGGIICLCPQILNITEVDQMSVLAHEIYHVRHDAKWDEENIINQEIIIPVTYEDMPQNIQNEEMKGWRSYNAELSGEDVSLSLYIQYRCGSLGRLLPRDYYYNEMMAYNYELGLGLGISNDYRKGAEWSRWLYTFIYEHYNEILELNNLKE